MVSSSSTDYLQEEFSFISSSSTGNNSNSVNGALANSTNVSSQKPVNKKKNKKQQQQQRKQNPLKRNGTFFKNEILKINTHRFRFLYRIIGVHIGEFKNFVGSTGPRIKIQI